MKIKIKIRKSWGAMSPVTRIVPNKKVYSRKAKKWLAEQFLLKY